MAKVVLIHTVAGLENVFGPLCDEVAPGLAPNHVVDESLLNDTIAAGALTDDVRARFRARAGQARADGADVIMLTCSSVGPSADGLGEELGVTVLRVDEAMAERAVELGPAVGGAAAGLGRPVEVTTRLAEGAFEALRSGDGERHDALVNAALQDLASTVDVI